MPLTQGVALGYEQVGPSGRISEGTADLHTSKGRCPGYERVGLSGRILHELAELFIIAKFITNFFKDSNPLPCGQRRQGGNET